MDGVLWAMLGTTGSPQVVLTEWALALGVPPARIGELHDATELARTTHDAIGDKRVLLIADDVWELSVALALRVGGPNSARIISTRSPAVALDFAGAQAFVLRELNSVDSVNLLNEFAPEVVRAHANEAQALCDAVGGLPLSLALIGSRLRQVGHVQQRRIRRELVHLHDAAARVALTQPESPLDRRNGLPKNAPTTLESVIALSDAQLGSDARRLLYALSFSTQAKCIYGRSGHACGRCECRGAGCVGGCGADRVRGRWALSRASCNCRLRKGKAGRRRGANATYVGLVCCVGRATIAPPRCVGPRVRKYYGSAGSRAPHQRQHCAGAWRAGDCAFSGNSRRLCACCGAVGVRERCAGR